MQLTATQLIKKAIVQRINEQNYDDYQQPINTVEEIEVAYDLAVEKDLHWDWENEVRSGGIETELPAPFSRHYECDIHAQKIDDQWVGYPFFYAGGKYGQPQEMEWISDAFFVDCKEEEKLVVVRTFSKKV